jgi:protein-S-isoprenylcysteine O-methyltransferase Ste14
MIFCRWSEYENDLILWSFGLPLMVLGLVIRVWATKHIGKRVARKYKEGRRPHLVVTGPYTLVRNPLYIGNIVAMMGLSILSELVWLMPAVLAYFFLLYSLVVRYEEFRLSVLFGKEYEIYRQQVPRWIPRFSRIGESKGGPFTWFQSLKGEFPGFASTSIMILILLGKEIIGS